MSKIMLPSTISIKEIMELYQLGRSAAYLSKNRGYVLSSKSPTGHEAKAAKLNQNHVKEILELRIQNMTATEIAEKIGVVSRVHIEAIIRGDFWGEYFKELRVKVAGINLRNTSRKRNLAKKGDEAHYEMKKTNQ